MPWEFRNFWERYSWNMSIENLFHNNRLSATFKKEKENPLNINAQNFHEILYSWPSLTFIPLLRDTRDKFGILIIVNCHGFEDIEKEGEREETGSGSCIQCIKFITGYEVRFAGRGDISMTSIIPLIVRANSFCH